MFVMSNYNFELWKRLDKEVTEAGFSQETEVGTRREGFSWLSTWKESITMRRSRCGTVTVTRYVLRWSHGVPARGCF